MEIGGICLIFHLLTVLGLKTFKSSIESGVAVYTIQKKKTTLNP